MTSGRNYRVDDIAARIAKPLLYVDYNELVNHDLVLLCQTDAKRDFFGRWVALREGLEVVGYQQDAQMDGTRDDILMEGICTRNGTGAFPHVTWLLRAGPKGIRYMSDIAEQGW